MGSNREKSNIAVAILVKCTFGRKNIIFFDSTYVHYFIKMDVAEIEMKIAFVTIKDRLLYIDQSTDFHVHYRLIYMI